MIEADRPRAGSGNTEFEDFYRSHLGSARALAHVMTGSLPLGQEIAQEALLAVHDSWDTIASPAAYLRMTVVNMSRSAQRRLIRERLHVARLSRSEPVTSIPEIDETWNVIRLLRPDQRMIVVLRYYEDLSVDEIAALLDKPIGTVKSTLHRTLSHLKDALDA